MIYMANEDITVGELHRKVDRLCSKVDEVLEVQQEQGTQLAVMNEHIENQKNKIDSNCSDVDLLKKRQRKIIGIGVALGFIAPLVVSILLGLW